MRLNGRPRVIVVDDNVDLAENVAELLEGLSDELDISFSRGARGAMDIALHTGFDLAIVDLRLSEGDDGLALLPKLRSACPEGEVILMTGHATLDTAVSAVRQGAFAYVLKPFDPEELMALGQRALAQVRLRRERARLSAELAASEAIHRAVVEHSDALLVGLRGDGSIRFASPHTRALVGESVNEVFLDTFADASSRPLLEPLIQSALSGSSEHSVRGTLKDPEGVVHTIRWTLSPMKETATGVVALAVGIDVTDQLAAERAMRRSESMAAMGRLTAGLAHEIRNPLNGALLQLELLKRQTRKLDDEKLAGDFNDTTEVIKRELRGLAALLEDFLTMARVAEPRMDPFDLTQVAEEVVTLQKPVAAELGVELEVDCVASAAALGQSERIRQAVLNLVRNAIEATSGTGGKVTVEVSEAADNVRLTVLDNGPGFSEEMLEHAFMPFQTDKEGGTGLGLSIVERLIYTHGGEVFVHNRPDGGAAVGFRLPGTIQ